MSASRYVSLSHYVATRARGLPKHACCLFGVRSKPRMPYEKSKESLYAKCTQKCISFSQGKQGKFQFLFTEIRTYDLLNFHPRFVVAEQPGVSVD